MPKELANPDLLVGLSPGDDAAVYRLSADRALVATVDLITPVVDDPFDFGRIAATNSISDIYAMGARPLLSLSVACFSTQVPTDALAKIVAGAAETAIASGCPIVGGHTVKDAEVKFGLVVIGEVHPDKMLRISGACVGDLLLMNKPIGSAALATAFKNQRFGEEDERYRVLLQNFLLSNAEAAEIAVRHGANSATDITGFGIAGHLKEMALASDCAIQLEYSQIAQLLGAVELLHDGFTCGGAKANAEFLSSDLEVNVDLKDSELELLFDPQTSGPLVISLPEKSAVAALRALQEAGYKDASIIGKVVNSHGGLIKVG